VLGVAGTRSGKKDVENSWGVCNPAAYRRRGRPKGKGCNDPRGSVVGATLGGHGGGGNGGETSIGGARASKEGDLVKR